jgi:hypothetical protein
MKKNLEDFCKALLDLAANTKSVNGYIKIYFDPSDFQQLGEMIYGHDFTFIPFAGSRRDSSDGKMVGP